MASSTLPPQVSVVLLGMSGFWGLHPRTVTVPPVLPPELELAVLPLLPPPQAAASSATDEIPATMATVRVVPRIDVLLLGVCRPDGERSFRAAHRLGRSPVTHRAFVCCGPYERALREQRRRSGPSRDKNVIVSALS